MKHEAKLIAITFASCILWATSAVASSYYLTLNAGAARLKDRCANTATGFECKNIAPAYGLDAGYQFSEMFGAELGLGNFGLYKTSGQLFGSDLDVSHQVLGAKLSATITVPLSNSFALTGKLGAARTSTNASTSYAPGPAIEPYTASANSLVYGLGFKYKLNDSFALRMQYENIAKTGDETLGTDSLSLLTVGLSYQLGKTKNSPLSSKPYAQAPASKPQPPVRFIVFLERAPGEDKQKLASAIGEACQCDPAFVRMYNNTSVMYQINLAPGLTFPGFKNALLGDHIALGMKGLMQSQ